LSFQRLPRHPLTNNNTNNNNIKNKNNNNYNNNKFRWPTLTSLVCLGALNCAELLEAEVQGVHSIVSCNEMFYNTTADTKTPAGSFGRSLILAFLRLETWDSINTAFHFSVGHWLLPFALNRQRFDASLALIYVIFMQIFTHTSSTTRNFCFCWLVHIICHRKTNQFIAANYAPIIKLKQQIPGNQIRMLQAKTWILYWIWVESKAIQV